MRNLIIDFDSTIVSVETVDFLFELVLQNRSDQKQVLDQVRQITAAGMNGEINFHQSLQQRLTLLPLHQEQLPTAISQLEAKISPSFIQFCREFGQSHNLQVVSGGFRELIEPLLRPLGILPNQIHANQFVFERGQLIGVDWSHALAHDQGKVRTVFDLNLEGETMVVGDGYTDYEIKAEGLAQTFIYYAEHAQRPKIMKLADDIVNDFRELSGLL